MSYILSLQSTCMFAFIAILFASPVLAATQQASVEQIALQYGLTTSTTFPFPSATQATANAQALIVSEWSLGKGRIQDNPDNLAFVEDPFPNKPPPIASGINNTGPVLQATYAAGSFSHDSGGSQFYNLWNTTDGSSFQTMLVSYEVAFDENFDWVKGGKLPGLRGGLNSTGCSGGNASNGKDCFSSRVMWRKNGAGEVYAYIPSPNDLCSDSNISCNSDFGISISRGSFGFVSGQWNRITMLVRLNDPPNVANGNIQLYYNDLQAINQTNLQIRSSSSVVANGFYFSAPFTFPSIERSLEASSDSTWATPNTTHTYYRSIRMWAGSAPSNLTGQFVSAASRPRATLLSAQLTGLALAGLFVALTL
ncbi:hypothetical protein Hypma_002633 [Hypsizygus marmoreus]|uniref:Polysaccharide lyase 14 domain-containing protein n=1 Tax=Hypsizygus marmoreus TaxID=39966 RepID=A0A369JDP4_HYPMA|nr:hypothetical protein Hypma_002633 [Hypsizygus marmoreus]